jgi:hypothetical protein
MTFLKVALNEGVGKSAALFMLLAGMFSVNAAAQPCQVTRHDPVTLYGVGEELGGLVAINMDHGTGNPVVVWIGEDHQVRISRYDGSAWTAHQAIDTGGIEPSFETDETSGESYYMRGLSLAVDSFSRVHLIIADESHVYHFVEAGGVWSGPEIAGDTVPPDPNDPHMDVRADFDSDDVLHVVFAIDRGNEASGKGLWYLRMDESGWSDQQWIAGGPMMHMRVEQRRAHVACLSFYGMTGPDDEWRNYQGHYRQCLEDGTWLDEEQATNEPPIGTLGPVAIHPAVAAGPDGIVHMIYPVDPAIIPEDSTVETGHASIITRDAAGTWSDPTVIFPENAIHAAFVDIVIDPAGVIYVFGINWQKRFRIDAGEGFTVEQFWHFNSRGEPTFSRWFYYDSVAAPSGAWLAYVAGRRWGPVEVVHFERTGDCGIFCGDGRCGADEDACSCLFDCLDSCCIEGAAHADGDADPSDPCMVCRPGENRRAWTYDPTVPGCMTDAVVEAPDPVEEPGSEIAEAPEDSIPENAETTTAGGCGCRFIPVL